MKYIIGAYIGLMVFTFVLDFHLNKQDDTCYQHNNCFKEVMMRRDRENILLSGMCSVITPVCLPIDIYLIIKYQK